MKVNLSIILLIAFIFVFVVFTVCAKEDPKIDKKPENKGKTESDDKKSNEIKTYSFHFNLNDGMKFEETCYVKIENTSEYKPEKAINYEGTTTFDYSLKKTEDDILAKVKFKDFVGQPFYVKDNDDDFKKLAAETFQELKDEYVVNSAFDLSKIKEYSPKIKERFGENNNSKYGVIKLLMGRKLVLHTQAPKPVVVGQSWEGNPPILRFNDLQHIDENAVKFKLKEIKMKNDIEIAIVSLSMNVNYTMDVKGTKRPRRGNGTGEILFDLTHGVPIEINFEGEFSSCSLNNDKEYDTVTSKCKTKTMYKFTDYGNPPLKRPIDIVNFKSDDGLDIYGNLIKGDTDKAIICVHMFPGSRRDYRELMPKLAEKGYTVLSIDTRGCPKGDTGRDKYQDLYQKFSPELFKIVYKDVLAAKKFLVEKHKISKDKIGLIGGSIGCSIVLMSAVEDESFKNLVLMSPGLDWADIDNLENMKKLGKRNVLITYGKEERGYKGNIDKLEKAATEDTKITVHPLEGNAHAGFQFEKNPEVIKLIVKFISDNLK